MRYKRFDNLKSFQTFLNYDSNYNMYLYEFPMFTNDGGYDEYINTLEDNHRPITLHEFNIIIKCNVVYYFILSTRVKDRKNAFNGACYLYKHNDGSIDTWLLDYPATEDVVRKCDEIIYDFIIKKTKRKLDVRTVFTLFSI